MNINETTGEPVRRSIYQELRDEFKLRAQNWNGIWTAYLNKSPAWGGRWAGNRIVMREQIPYNLRYDKFMNHNGTVNHEYQDIAEESNIVHTVGNENNIRRSIRSLNTKMYGYFEPSEYGFYENYDKRTIKSYKVNYVEYDTNLDIIDSKEYWTDSYQTFKKDDMIKLYEDGELTKFVVEAPVVYKSSDPYKKVCIEWTGDRYYINQSVSIIDGSEVKDGQTNVNTIYDVAYSNPTNMNANNSRGVIVSCSHYSKIYALFNNASKQIAFSNNPTVDKPTIIYFRIEEPLKLTSYMLRADNKPSKWESPCDWTMEASNNNINWTVIDTHTNEDDNWAQNMSRTFNIANPQPYLYFRLVITRSRKTGSKLELGGMRFYGYTGNLNATVTQPELIGSATNVNVSELGVKSYSQLSENPDDVYNNKKLLSNPDVTSFVEQDDIPDTILSNQECVYTFDNNSNWKLGNEDIIKKHEYKQLQQILQKIDKCLKLRDGWFDGNNKCNINCQVACQNTCQVSCQYCNVSQCHDQKCGTH